MATDVRCKTFGDPQAPFDPPNLRTIARELELMQTRPDLINFRVKIPMVEQHIAEALGLLNELTAALDELKEEHRVC
jgi:hypothetical protein